jgi:hypothetical protein
MVALTPIIDKRDAMYRISVRGDTGEYALATGEEAAYRLGILHELYGPGTRRVLLKQASSIVRIAKAQTEPANCHDNWPSSRCHGKPDAKIA